MLNPSAYALGANRSCIRDLFEYGCQRAAVVGRENVYDYSLGNPNGTTNLWKPWNKSAGSAALDL